MLQPGPENARSVGIGARTEAGEAGRKATGERGKDRELTPSCACQGWEGWSEHTCEQVVGPVEVICESGRASAISHCATFTGHSCCISRIHAGGRPPACCP